MPAGARTGRIVVTAGRAKVFSPKRLVIAPAAPTVTSIAPNSGGLNTLVTVNGTGFTAPASVSFHGTSATATVVSGTKLTVRVPVGASTGAVTVTTAGSTVAAGTFTVTPSLLLSPTVGTPSSTTNVYGAGFGASELVDLYFGTTDVAVVATTTTGTFTYAGFPVPASAQPGTSWISAEGRRSGSGAQAAFLVRTDWSQLGFKAGGGRYNPYENTLTSSNVSGLTQAWSFNTGASVDAPIAVAGGLAYVINQGGGLRALDATTGALKWTYPGVVASYASPAVSNGVVYVTSSTSGAVYALNATTGALIWSQALSSPASYSSPVVAGGAVYTVGQNGTVFAFNAANGTPLWTNALGCTTVSSSAVSGGILYTGCGLNMNALDAATGTVKWTYTTGGTVEGNPAVVNGVVYFGADDARYYAVNAKNGAFLWSNTLGGNSYGSAAVANGVVYVGGADAHIYAFNAATGATLWNITTAGIVGAGLAVANGVVYADTYADRLLAIDAYSGAVRWTYVAGDEFFFDPPTVTNGTVYVGSYDGVVHAFNLNPANTGGAAQRPALSRLRPNPNLRPTQ